MNLYLFVFLEVLFLLDLGTLILPTDTHLQLNNWIPVEIAQAPGSPRIAILEHRWRTHLRECKQKRGCRAGVIVHLRRIPHRPPLPSPFVANVRPLNNKMADLRLVLSARTLAQDS